MSERARLCEYLCVSVRVSIDVCAYNISNILGQ